jgi:hypothetical protein
VKEKLLAKWKDSYEYYSCKGDIRPDSQNYFYNIELYEHLKNLMRLGISPATKDMEANLEHFEKEAIAKSAAKIRGLDADGENLNFMFEKLEEVILTSAISLNKESGNKYYNLTISAVLNTDAFTKKEIDSFIECFGARFYEVSSGLIFYPLTTTVTSPPLGHEMPRFESMCHRKIKSVFVSYAKTRNIDIEYKQTLIDKIKDYLTLIWS